MRQKNFTFLRNSLVKKNGFGTLKILRNRKKVIPKNWLRLSDPELDRLLKKPGSLEYTFGNMFINRNPCIIFKNSNWYIYKDTHWEVLPSSEIGKLIARFCKSKNTLMEKDLESLGFSREADGPVFLFEEDKERRAFLKKVTEMGSFLTSKNSWEKIRQYLETDVDFQYDPIDGNFISFRDGILDVENKKLLKHTPKIFTIYVLSCSFRNLTEVGSFGRDWFNSIAGDDRQKLFLLNLLCIYSLIHGNITPIFLLYGVPLASKSTLTYLAKLLAGHQVGFLDDKTGSSRFGLTALLGKKLTVIADTNSSDLNLLVSNLKKLTGNDVVTTDRKFRDITEVPQQKAVIINSNELPTFKNDSAIVRRLVPIYCPSVSNPNPKFQEEIVQNVDHFVYFALCGFFCFGEPITDFSLLRRDISNMSALSYFCRQHLVACEKTTKSYVSLTELRELYTEKKLAEDGIKARTFKQELINTLALEYGVVPDQRHTRKGVGFYGIRIRKPSEPYMEFKRKPNVDITRLEDIVQKIMTTSNLIQVDELGNVSIATELLQDEQD